MALDVAVGQAQRKSRGTSSPFGFRLKLIQLMINLIDEGWAGLLPLASAAVIRDIPIAKDN